MIRTAIYLMIAGPIFGFLPLSLALLAGGIGAMNGCTVNEAAAHPCQVLGLEIGDVLAMMFVGGWFTFYTLPIGILILLAGLVLLIVGLARRQFRRDENQSD